MPNLVLLNPRKRGTKAKVAKMSQAKGRRTAARNRHGQFVSRSRAAPAKRRRKAVATYAANPVPRVRRRRRHAVAAAPKIRRRRRIYRSNPIARTHRRSGKKLNIKALIVPAAMQGVGAVAARVAFNMVAPYIARFSPNLVTGQVRGLTQAVVGILLGMGVSNFSPRMGQYVAEGALTISIVDALSTFVPDNAGTMNAMYAADMGAMYRGNLRSMYRGNMGAMMHATPPGGRGNFGFATAAQTVNTPIRQITRGGHR